MQFFGPDEVAAALPWPELIHAVEAIMVDDQAQAPERTVHNVPDDVGGEATMLLKPGWVVGDVIVVKVVTFFPGNGMVGLSSVNAGVLVFSATNGGLLGACDGNELTTRRTAAASAVAAKRLARTDTRRLLVIGTGALAPMTAQAHATVRNYDLIEIWGRSRAKAEATVAALSIAGLRASVCDDLDESVSRADLISCVTSSTEALLKGSLISEGTHIDLVGGFTPTMREADDAVIERASLWVDSRAEGMLAGDLAQPLESGLITVADIEGDLRDLVAGPASARRDDDEITLFKSAGIALEDVAAARLVFGG